MSVAEMPDFLSRLLMLDSDQHSTQKEKSPLYFSQR